ncbi:MAG: hypothetical protein ACM3N5_11765 [Candidatus Eiseniibacteriota bacterium]
MPVSGAARAAPSPRPALKPATLPALIAALATFGAVAWLLAGAGAPHGLTAELGDIAARQTAGSSAELLRYFGEFATFVSATLFAALGLDGDSLRVVTVVTAAALLAFVAQSCARRGLSKLEIALILVAVAAHPIYLAAAISGSTMLMRGVAFFALVTWLYRIEFVGDVQSKMTFGIVLAAMVLLDPNAGYVLIPILILLPWIYRNIGSGAEALAAYILILTPAVLSGAAILIACTLASGLAPWHLVSLWLAPLHGATPVPGAFRWYDTLGGDFGGALFALSGLALASVPMTALVLTQAVVEPRQRVLPRTAALSLILPVAAGALATYFHHAQSAWPILLNLLAAALAWLCKAHLSDRARMAAIALLFAGSAIAWVYPPLWQEPGLAAWRATVLSLIQ